MTNLATLAAVASTGGFALAVRVYSDLLVALNITAAAGPENPSPRRLFGDRHVQVGAIATGLIVAWLAALIIAA